MLKLEVGQIGQVRWMRIRMRRWLNGAGSRGFWLNNDFGAARKAPEWPGLKS